MSRGKALREDELEFINAHLGDMSVSAIAKKLGRNYYTIYNLSKEAGIERNHTFTQQEDEYIRENYAKLPVERIASRFGVSVMSVYNRARKLGITKNQRRSETA